MKNFLSILMLAFSAVFISATLPNSDGGYSIGDTAENFQLMNVDGNMVSLEDYEDAKGYVVIFTCNTCPYAKFYEDRIIALHQELKPLGYPVIAINPNDPSIKPGDSFEEMKYRSSEKEYPFPYLFDEKQEIFPKFGAKATPHAYVLDENRVVKYIGAIDDSPRDSDAVKVSYVKDAVAAIGRGEDPEVTYTKAIGCGIKSKKYNKLKGIKKQKKVNKLSKSKMIKSAIK